MAVVIRVVCSNVASKAQTVAELLDMDVDVALLQDLGPGVAHPARRAYVQELGACDPTQDA